MYPHGFYHHYRCGRPSRLIWFALGAGAATFFISRKEANRHNINHNQYWGHCRRTPVQAPPSMQPSSPVQYSQPHGQQQMPMPTQQQQTQTPMQPGLPPYPFPTPQAPTHGSDNEKPPYPVPAYPSSVGGALSQAQQQLDQQWEEDKARMLALTARASDTMADLSEATLDSIASTVQELKVKLAEHRAQRANSAQQQQHPSPPQAPQPPVQEEKKRRGFFW